MTFTEGELLQLVQRLLDRFEDESVTHVTVNHNLQCKPHVDRNAGVSWITTFGSYTEGYLRVGSSSDFLQLAGPDMRGYFERFHGGCLHWNTPF